VIGRTPLRLSAGGDGLSPAGLSAADSLWP